MVRWAGGAFGAPSPRGAACWPPARLAPILPISARRSSPRREANAPQGYKQMITQSAAEDIVYSNLFTGVHGNYLKPSIIAAGLDPENLPQSDPSRMNFGSGGNTDKKAWKDIWGCGQGIGLVKDVLPRCRFDRKAGTRISHGEKAIGRLMCQGSGWAADGIQKGAAEFLQLGGAHAVDLAKFMRQAASAVASMLRAARCLHVTARHPVSPWCASPCAPKGSSGDNGTSPRPASAPGLWR